MLSLKYTLYGRVRTAWLRGAADEIRITILFFTSFGAKKIHYLVASSKKLANSFAGLVTIGLGLDVARGPLVGSRWHRACPVSGTHQ